MFQQGQLVHSFHEHQDIPWALLALVVHQRQLYFLLEDLVHPLVLEYLEVQ